MTRGIVIIPSVLGAGLLLLFSRNGPSETASSIWVGTVLLPLWSVVLLALFCGGAAAWAIMVSATPPAEEVKIARAAALPLPAAVAGVLLIAGVGEGALGPAPAAVVFVLLMLTFLAGRRCLDLLARGEQIGIESHWGGLGGGSGGWRLLPPTGPALLSLAFAGAAVGLVIGGTRDDPSLASETAANNAETGNPAADNVADAQNGAARQEAPSENGAGEVARVENGMAADAAGSQAEKAAQ